MGADGGPRNGSRRLHRYTIVHLLLVTGLAVVVGGAAAAGLAGLGHRWEWWHFSTGFLLLRWGVYATIAGVILSASALVVALFVKRPRLAMAALPAIALGAAVISVPLVHIQRASGVPAIHDISTDLDDPPAFVALRSVREAAPNGVEHPGETTAQLQREAYSDVAPMRLAAGREAVFEGAEELARDMGWQIIDADASEGRIEAVDRTFWFGFSDDVVIRIIDAGDAGTRVDVRSASRVGKGDVGANARRIRTFLSRLQARF